MWKLPFAVVSCLMLLACAQKAPKKSHVLVGKVEAVDAGEKTLTVNHQKVDNWMDAMTMAYPVHDASALTTVKPGDRIEAKVYDDDYSLYDVKVTGNGK